MEDMQTKKLTYAEVSGDYNPETQSWNVDGYFTEDMEEEPTKVAEIFLNGNMECVIEGITPDTDKELRDAISSFHCDDYITEREGDDFLRYMLYAYKDLRYERADIIELVVYNPDGECVYEITKTLFGDQYIYGFRLKDADEWTAIFLKDDTDREICDKVIHRLYEDIVSAVGEVFRLITR